MNNRGLVRDKQGRNNSGVEESQKPNASANAPWKPIQLVYSPYITSNTYFQTRTKNSLKKIEFWWQWQRQDENDWSIFTLSKTFSQRAFFVSPFVFFGAVSCTLLESATSFFFKRRAMRSLSSQLASYEPGTLSNCAKKENLCIVCLDRCQGGKTQVPCRTRALSCTRHFLSAFCCVLGSDRTKWSSTSDPINCCSEED